MEIIGIATIILLFGLITFLGIRAAKRSSSSKKVSGSVNNERPSGKKEGKMNKME